MRAAFALVFLLACGKSDAEREKDRLEDRAAEELKVLKEKLGGLETKASKLDERIADVDKQLAKLYDELSMAIDDQTRAAIVEKLDELQVERGDIEKQIDELRGQIPK